MLAGLRSRVRRAASKRPSYVAWRALHEARGHAERFVAPRRVRSLTPDALCQRLRAPSIEALWDRCASSPWPFCPPTVDPADLERLCPGEGDAIVRAADRALEHRVDLVGSGDVELGPRIDWLVDRMSGKRWPEGFSRAIEVLGLGQPSDVKFPWELSRLQWALPLGQAWRLTGEDRYAEGARQLLDDWIDANPYAWTVNWSCTKEPALRILTWTWLFFALRDSAAFADPGFRFRLLKALYLHADYTERHFERSDINGNHFTANAAGLVFAGLFFGEARAPERWARAGLRHLVDDVEGQVFPDGVDFEASVPYHRLVCELFALPAIYAQAHGRAVPPAYRARMAAMAEFVASYSRGDGSSPLWGDADDGRAMPMRHGHLQDHRYLVGLVGSWLGDDGLLRWFDGPVAELYWLLGPPAGAALVDRAAPPARSRAFPDGGFYVLAHGDDHVFVDCGPVGMAGRGGHGHNDTLSFEAALQGRLLVTDSGCFVYTGSVEERNRFRATDAHNTPRVDGEEINSLRPLLLWTLGDDTRPAVREWTPQAERTVLVAEHDGYARLPSPVTVVRRFELDGERSSLVVEDSLEGTGRHTVEIPLHLAAGVEVSQRDDAFELAVGGRRFLVTWSTGGWQPEQEASRVSPSYGVAVASTRLVWRRTGSLPAGLTVTIVPSPPT